MKKNYFKKSIALLMTVMMLMTCWVFVAPEHNDALAAADDVAATNKANTDALSFDTTFTTVRGSFPNDNDNLSDADYNNVYHNVLYIGTVGEVASSTKRYETGTIKRNYNEATISWYYPEATLIYDGDTNDLPRLGVAIKVYAYRGGTWAPRSINYSSWIASGGNGFGFNEDWRGPDGDAMNLQWMWNGNGAVMGHIDANDTDKSFEVSAGITKSSKTGHAANLIKFLGNESNFGSEYIISANPVFRMYGSNSSKYATFDPSAATKTLRIVNYVPLKNAIDAAKAIYDNELSQNYAKYSVESVEEYANLVDKLQAARPNNYINASSNDYDGYASAASDAVTAWNNWSGLKLATYTVSFLDYKGTEIHSETVEYGTTNVNPGDTARYVPAADAKNHYTFTGWDKSFSPVTDDVVVTVTYATAAHDFTALSGNSNIVSHGDGTHSWTCSGCTAYGVKDGNMGDKVACPFPEEWSGDYNNHYKQCPDCKGKTEHTPTWLKNNLFEANDISNKCGVAQEYYEQCDICKQSSEIFGGTPYKTDKINSHIRGRVTVTKEPDCGTGEDGYQVEICSRCNYEFKETDENSLTGPIAAEHKPEKRASYIDETYHGYKCEKCNQMVNIGEHKWFDNGENTPAECDKNGTHDYECVDCRKSIESEYAIDENGKFTSEFVAPALNHKVDGVSTYEYYEDADHQPLAPTCSAEGYHYEKCSLCGDIKQVTDAIDPDAHVYSSAVSNGNGTHTATCTLNSAHVITDPCTDMDKDCVCDTCGYNIPHDYQNIVTEGMLVSGADCNSYAVYKKSCSVCGVAHESETFEDVASGYGAHDWAETRTFIKSVAKCETDAVYYYECLECGASSEAHGGATWTDKGTGYPHNYAPKADNSNIVNNNDGTHSYYCQNECGTVGGTTGCNFGKWDVNNANGHQKTCLDCGYTTALEAHNWGEGWKPAEGNTGDAKGEMTRTCTVCARTETTTCVYDQEVVVDATCMNDKYTEYTCSTCGHGYTVREPGTKLDHSYTGAYDIDAENDKHRQLCVNGCNQYGEWVECELTYTQVAGTETHTAECPDCGNVDTGDCFGGTATCIQKAKCEKCGGDHGDYAEHNFTGAAKNFGVEGEHNRVCAVEGCGEYNPVAEKCSGGTAYCTEKAICSECNTAYGEIDLNNHKNTTAQPGKAPTCMDDGYTDYATCDACGTELGKEVIPADPEAHKWSTSAVSTNDGKHYYACEYNA
ncbi:MAG: hypothetical protein IKB94_00995, partial [Clostridia bacterium]|nr:hypothetical protein [Clostridia bacterium]